jgi:hypothetical protein
VRAIESASHAGQPRYPSTILIRCARCANGRPATQAGSCRPGCGLIHRDAYAADNASRDEFASESAFMRRFDVYTSRSPVRDHGPPGLDKASPTPSMTSYSSAATRRAQPCSSGPRTPPPTGHTPDGAGTQWRSCAQTGPTHP